jgi:hypothetical protein
VRIGVRVELVQFANRHSHFYSVRARDAGSMARAEAVKTDEGGKDLIVHTIGSEARRTRKPT